MIKVGEKIPSAVFKYLTDQGPQTISTDQLLPGKKVVLFSVPGAFTQKSTDLQVPGYLELADQIYAKGVSDIICVSVNDSFVMDAWARHCAVGGKIRMLADGHCEFFTMLGLQMDCSRFTLGWRCHRFSMIIEDGILTSLNLEEPGIFDKSDAKTILSQL